MSESKSSDSIPCDFITLINQTTGLEEDFELYNETDLPLVADSSFVMTKLIDLGGMDDDVDTDEE